MPWIIMLFLPVFSAVLTEVFQLSFLVSTLLFFGLPALYLTWKNPRLFKKAALFSLIMGTPMLLIFDHMAYLDQTWFVPNSAWRFMRDSIPIEDAAWSYLLVYFTVMAWEQFFVKKPVEKISKKKWYFIWFCVALLTVFFGFYWLAPEKLVVAYFYPKMMVLFEILPVLVLLALQPKIWLKLTLFTLYFFATAALAEITGLRQYQWYFAGPHYLDLYNLFGHLLPLDEILAWWTFAAPGTIAWYSFFWLDNKNKK